jgi:beta-lactam-binding protein with PASTA domain
MDEMNEIEKSGENGKNRKKNGGATKTFVFMTLGLLAFTLLIGGAIFSFAVRGAEQTMVPDVCGKDIIAALLELQEKELYPQIQVRFSSIAAERGVVLEQEPAAGTIVKAGRRIRLTISQGAVINRVEDYRGRSIDEARAEIQAVFAGADRPAVTVKEPFMYEYAPEPAGTILRQHPDPGSSLAGAATLEFVVSLGMERAMVKTPGFTGLSLKDALALIGKTNTDFSFSLRPAQDKEKGETVVDQSPLPEIEMEANTRVKLTLTSPEKTARDEVFSLFKYSLPKNPYPIAVKLDVLRPFGERETLLKTKFSGGELTVPYKLPIGSVLILSMLDRELHRETVSAPIEF